MGYSSDSESDRDSRRQKKRHHLRFVLGVCVKCGSAGANTCKMRESVRVITRILHMVNSDPSQGKVNKLL